MKKAMITTALMAALAVPMAITPDTADAFWKKFKRQMGNSNCWGLAATFGQSKRMKEGCKRA